MPKPNRPEAKKRKKFKSNDAEMLARVEEVLTIRIDGAQIHDVRTYSSEKGWGLSERQLREYMRRADELLVSRHDKSRKRALARHFAQRAALYARSVNAADYRTALSVLADEARLRGLYPADKVKVDANVRSEQVTEVVVKSREEADKVLALNATNDT